MVVGIYIRVSTDEQAQEGYSISAQKERLKAFCVAQNWTDHKFYIDEGVSGRSTNRPQFKKLLDDVKSGSINILLVYRLDRLTRSVRDLHETLDYLEKYNCVFRSATEIYDTSTAMGRMFITIVAAIAEWESANLGERVKMGQIEKARQGEWAAQPPYGWYKDSNHKLQIDSEQIKAVKLMVSKIKEGLSFRQLADYMNGTNYKPKRGYKWHIRTLMELMHNPALYGAMYWGGKTYEGTHEGIMSKKEFEELQRIISSRQNVKKRNVNSHFIYQTKIVCPDCGNRCTSERSVWRNKDGVQKVSHSYRCQACVLNKVEHTPFTVSEVDMNRMLIEHMKGVSIMPSTEEEVDDITFTEISSELKRIENQREKFQRAWSLDLMTDDEFTKLMSESRIRYDELQRELSTMESSVNNQVPTEIQIERAKMFNRSFYLLTQEERRNFVQSFIESINIEIVKRASAKRSRDKELKIASVHFY